MAVLNEGMHEGEFIGELAMGVGFHVDAGTLISGQKLVAGTVTGLITASAKDTILAPGASDGSQNVAGIIVPNCDATLADAKTRFMRRGPAVVNGNDLTWPAGITGTQKITAIAQLMALGIKVA